MCVDEIAMAEGGSCSEGQEKQTDEISHTSSLPLLMRSPYIISWCVLSHLLSSGEVMYEGQQHKDKQTSTTKAEVT